MTQKYDRFKAAPWFQEGVQPPPVLIGGAGGIGSWLTLLLNRAGFETWVHDFDTLEAINMAGQLFMHKSIGQYKVDALRDIVKDVCQEMIIGSTEKIDENSGTNEVVFSAFDNMKARKDMFTTWAQTFKGNSKAIFVDGRLTAEQLTIFCIKGDDEAAFEEYQREHLFDDSAVAELPCTFKQTSHGAAMIAAHMVEQFTNWYSSAVLSKDLSRTAEFFWEYFIPISYHSSRAAIGNTEWKNRPIESPVITEVIDTPRTLTTEEAKQRAIERLAKFGTPSIDKFILGEMTENQLREVYQTPQQEGPLGETEEADLTPEEIKEMDDYINERTEMDEQDRREVTTLIAEGLSAPNTSLAFEEEDVPSITDVPPTINPDDIPF